MSHAETLAMCQRALARMDFPVEYSRGFNPHQRLSLPLPRSVGLEVDEDILCIRMETEASLLDVEDFKARFSSQLPDGCEVINANVAQTNSAARPIGATYLLEVQPDCFDENLKNRVGSILEQDSINVRRKIDEKGTIREVDVRPYLGAINVKGACIEVQCIVSPQGSIRVDEILKLLELDVMKLSAPVRRIKINWQTN